MIIKMLAMRYVLNLTGPVARVGHNAYFSCTGLMNASGPFNMCYKCTYIYFITLDRF